MKVDCLEDIVLKYHHYKKTTPGLFTNTFELIRFFYFLVVLFSTFLVFWFRVVG